MTGFVIDLLCTTLFPRNYSIVRTDDLDPSTYALRSITLPGRTHMKARKHLLAMSLLVATAAFATPQQNNSAKQDMSNAGQDTKAAAQNTGSAAKKTAKKTGNAAKKTTNKGAQKTQQGAQKVQNKTQSNPQ